MRYKCYIQSADSQNDKLVRCFTNEKKAIDFKRDFENDYRNKRKSILIIKENV